MKFLNFEIFSYFSTSVLGLSSCSFAISSKSKQTRLLSLIFSCDNFEILCFSAKCLTNSIVELNFRPQDFKLLNYKLDNFKLETFDSNKHIDKYTQG
ncbi:hypothetical protein BpHYR1_001185 [Brachionus plicatilis]|uniref:Lipoprotein n=1 Tax=Brachionus plicatilis TaxID=10195 RepID=A0A3M7SRC8_BRAPC|nr:hypothetical protein BpHYR1_001185 [Brachionus plicatilis]